MAAIPVVFGYTASGELLIQGTVREEVSTSAHEVHHHESKSHFEAESWSGEHEEHNHHQEERRDSMFMAHESHQQSHEKSEDTPIASSEHFERKRTASLAAALLEIDPRGAPLIHFFHPTAAPFVEAEEKETPAQSLEVEKAGESERVISSLLFLLREMKTTAPDKYTSAVERLRELEAELRTAGAVTPADPAVSDAVARALAAAGPGRDIQIRVNQSRHTTTTKTVYETETPGMAGLDTDKIRELHQQMLASITSGPTDSTADSGTTQKKETAEEGFTNEDGSVVVSKKMTRVVTTTKTTLPGEGEAVAPESPTESLGSVKDRIAKFEQLKEGDRASVTSLASGGSADKEEESKRSSLERISVDIVVTPVSPLPPGSDEEDEIAEAQEPLSPSVEEVSQAEVKSLDSYGEESPRVSEKHLEEEQEPLSPETDRSSTADLVSSDTESARRHKKREILEQSTTTTYGFTTQKEDRRHLQRGDEGEHPEDFAAEEEHGFVKETALESPAGQAPFHRTEVTSVRTEHHEELESPSAADKLKSFAKGAGKVLVAPVALAAAGAVAAYEKLKGESDEEEEPTKEQPEELHLEERQPSLEHPEDERLGTPESQKEDDQEEILRELEEEMEKAEAVKENPIPSKRTSIAEPVAEKESVSPAPIEDHWEVHREPDQVVETTTIRKVSMENPEVYEYEYPSPVEELPETEELAVPPVQAEEAESPEERNRREIFEQSTTTTYDFTTTHEDRRHLQEGDKEEVPEEHAPVLLTGTPTEVSPHHVVETTKIVKETFDEGAEPHVLETTTISKEYYEEPSGKEAVEPEVEYEERFEEPHRHVETTTIKREYDEEFSEATSPVEDLSGGKVFVTKETFFEPETEHIPVHVVETTTITKEYTESPEHVSPVPIEEHIEVHREPDHIVETTTLRRYSVEEPEEHISHLKRAHEEEDIAGSPAKKTHYYEEEEPESPSAADKLKDFAKGAGKVLVAPVALAAAGALAAYEKLKDQSDEEEEEHHVKKTPEAEELHLEERLSLGEPGKLKEDVSTIVEVGTPESQREVEQEEVLRELEAEMDKEPVEEELESPVTQREIVPESPKELGLSGLEVPEEQLAPSDLASSEDETGPSEKRRPSSDIFYDKPESPVRDRDISPSAGLPEGLESPVVARKEYFHEEVPFSPFVSEKEEPVSPVPGDESEKLIEEPAHIVETTISHRDYYEEPTEEEGPQPGVITEVVEEDIGSFHHVIETTQVQREYHEQPSDLTSSTGSDHDSTLSIKSGQIVHEEPEQRHVVETTTVTKETFYDKNDEQEGEEEQEEHEQPHHIVETTMVSKEYYEEPSRVEEEEPLSPTRSEPIEEFIEVPHRVTFAPEVTKNEAEMVEEEDEHKTCHVVETTTTVKEIYFEEEPKEEELEHLPEEEDHHEKRHVYETTTVTKEVYYEKPEHGEAESSSPAPSPVEEQQPVTRAEYGDEVPSDEESTKDKLLGFAKGVGKVAAGIVAAPVALAAVGAAAAYDKLKGEDQEEDQFAQESPREELEKRRTSHGEPPSAAETPLRETETHEEFVSQEVQNLELPHEPVTESHVEKEPETHEEYVSREVEELELPHKQFHEEETYVLKSPVRYEKDSETQEELVSRENEELELPHGEVEQETHYKEQSETFEREEHLEVPERPEIEKNEEPAPDTVSRVAEPASPIEEEHLEVPERPEIEKNEEPEPAIVKGQIEDAISPVSVEEPIQLGETITEYHEEKLPSPASSQKSFEERPHIVETTVVTKEIFYEEPSSPTFSEKGPEEKENVVRDNAREVEIFTSTRDYYDQKEDLPEATDISEEHHKVHETVTTVKETFYEPSSRESPVPSEQESVIERGSFEEEHREPQRVVETTTTVREYFEEPSPSASEKEFPEEPSIEETIIVGEDNEPLRFVETSTTKKEYFEEPTEFLEAPFEHHEPHRVIETMTVTKETYYEEPSTTHEPVTPEDEESTKEKLLSFGKKAGKIAAGIAIAPIALAAVGAQSAYEKLRGDEEEELPFWVDESAAPPSFPPPSYESVEQEDLRWKSLEQPQTVIEHAKEEETESSRDRGHLGLEVLGEQLAPSDLASPEDETGPSEERRPSKNIFYDKPESPVQDRVISPSAGLPEESSSPAASEKEDEGPSVLSALVDHEEPAKVIEHTIEVVSPEKESFEEEEDVIKPHHVVETTIVTKETFLEEPEEKTTEEETEARHVVETTITIKETDFEEPEDEEKDEQDLHRVVETFTTTQEYEQLEPAPEKSTETEEDLHESRYVTETKTVTKESFFDEPKEEVEGAEIPHHVVETTTTTRDIVEEPYISENTEENREKHIVEAIKTTTETYYDKESEDHPSHIKETVVVTKESVEEGESQVVETSTTVKETFFEEPESPTKKEHLETGPEYSIETTVSTKEIHFDEPKEAEHVIESAIYEPEAHHEEPSSPTVKERQFEEAEDYQQGLESPAESDEEATSPAKKKKGLGSKVFGFAKKAGMVVAAPVALAAKGASHAYDALKHKKEGQGEEVMHEGDERVYAFKGQEESGESAEASPETPRKTVEEIHGAPSTATFTTETEAEPHVIESTTYEDFSDAAAQAIKVDTVADEEEEDFEGDETHEIASTEYHPAHHEEQIHIEGKTETPEEEKHVIESETYEDLSERADIPIKIDTVADEEEEAPEEEHREEFIEKEEEHVIPSETHDISAPAYSLDDEQPHVIESTTYEDLSDTAVPIKVDTVADEEEEAPEQMSEEIPSVEYHPSHHDEEIHIEGKIESPDEEEYVIESAPYEEYSTVEAVHEPEEFAERRPSVAKREVAEEEEERTSASPVSTDSRIVHEEEREEPVRVETELVEETAPVVSGYTAFGEPINTGLVISAPPSPTEEQELQREQLVSFQERELQEDEEESTKDKIFGFAKDFGQVAAGVVAAPIALVAVGAASAYDALTGQKEEGKTTEEHLMKESPISERESAHGEHFGKESSVKESLPESATPSLEEEEKSHAIESHEAPFEFSPEEERRLTQEIEETSELESRVEEAVRSPMEDVQHRFEQEMEGYEPDEKETHETLFEEQLEKLAEEQGRRSSEELASLAEEYPSETAALAEEVPTKSEEEKALDEETSVEEHLMSPSQDVVVDIEIEEEEIGGRHHIIETTTIRREYDEELSSTESQKELAVEELPAEDAIYHHEIRDEEGHLVETTTITKEYYEEPEEEKESKEREEDESEGRHVVETKIVTKESFYDEPETRVEEGLEHERPPHIVETTTVTKEFYEEPEEKESLEVIEDRFEVHHEPTHVVETTIITKDYYEQPEEEEKAVEEQLETHHEPRHVVETTTITREYYDEAVSPAKEEFEHGLAEEGQGYSQRTEEELHHEKEPVHFTETTSITREYYEPEEKQPSVESEKAVEEQLEAHHEPRHVIETTTITREYFEEPEEQEQSSHKELEQLEKTAPVVSGYTASGEPINTGLIISAPPSPAKSLTEEQEESHVRSYEQEHQYHGEEVPSDEESTKDRLLGFAKGVGKVAAGIVVAPVALAAVGAAAAYDKLKGEDHEGHLVKEVYTGLPKVSEQQHLLEEPHVIESRETHFEESQRLVSPTTSPAEEERRFSQDIEKSSGLTSETRFEEEQVSHFKESPLEDVQHRFEEEMEGYVPETKETHETIFEEQLEKLAKETSLQSPTKESVKGSLSISDIASPTEEKHVEVEEEEKTEAVRKPSLGDEFDKVMEEEWLIPEKLTTEEEVLSPGTKLEINEFVTDVVEEATAGAVIEAAEDLTPRSQRDINLEELALENVARVRYEQEDEDEDEPARHLQSPQKQSEESPSSDQDESRLIAGDDEWKVYDSTGQVVEEFSAQLTDKAIEEAGSDVTHAFTAPVPARRALITQESINEVSMEPETDYQSDLQEKLDILAGQKPDALPIVREEELDVIRESDGESEEHDPIAETASRLVDEVIDTVLEEQEGPKTVTSDLFYSATEKSTKDENYDTCLTSQEDTYESAQGWTSQDSEYTTATSEAPSRLSEMEERTEGTMTPQAAVSPVAVSPVDSDRQFVVDLDNEGRPRPIRSFTLDDETARSTPDVALQITIEEEEDDDEQKMPTSPSGVLLGPVMDVGRPISPVPPRKMQMEDDERAFEFVARTGDKELVSEMSIDVPEQEQASGDASNESARYTRHSSELSSESHADTVIHKEKDDDQLTSTFVSQAGSTDSLDAASAKSTGRVSDGSSLKAEEPAEPIEKDSPRSQDLSPEQQMSPEQISPERHRDLETEEGFVIYQGEGNEGELETVEEEPEDAESLNGGSGSSSANGTTHLGRKYVSSDNVSLTSLQEFERLEQLVANRGDSSLTASEIELYAHGRPRSMEGSLSSLAEFEKLEAEVHHQQANQSPQDEMMLSVVKEESEAEDMSVRDDDEDDAFSETEIKSRPVNEEDARAGTPQALSPSDSLERDIITNIAILETSTDSLEPSYQREHKPSSSDIMVDSLTEYEIVPRHDSTRDSLENIPMDKDSLLEGASQDLASQETHGLLSGDTVGTYQEHDDDDKDSLEGEMESMLRSYPTTLTTFITTTEQPDGSVQTISRRVETRVVDPVMSHVTFTGTESQERLNQLPLEQQIETVDQQGNVTRTLFKRQAPHSE